MALKKGFRDVGEFLDGRALRRIAGKDQRFLKVRRRKRADVRRRTVAVRIDDLALPDAPVITGTSPEVFAYYGLTGEGIAKTVAEALK